MKSCPKGRKLPGWHKGTYTILGLTLCNVSVLNMTHVTPNTHSCIVPVGTPYLSSHHHQSDLFITSLSPQCYCSLIAMPHCIPDVMMEFTARCFATEPVLAFLKETVMSAGSRTKLHLENSFLFTVAYTLWGLLTHESMSNQENKPFEQALNNSPHAACQSSHYQCPNTPSQIDLASALNPNEFQAASPAITHITHSLRTAKIKAFFFFFFDGGQHHSHDMNTTDRGRCI